MHWWDWNTSIKEVMDNLHHLVAAGKVLYLGASDMPAWVVATANQYAHDHGKTPFVIYQGAWNVLERSFEREIIPMARAHGLALAPWNVLAAGKLRTDAEEQKRIESGEKGRTMFTGDWLRNENEKKISAALEKVAKEVGTEHITAVAIAYVLQKTPYVFPIIGGRKVEHLYANIEALKISLSQEQIEYLEGIIPFNPGFPSSMIVSITFSHNPVACRLLRYTISRAMVRSRIRTWRWRRMRTSGRFSKQSDLRRTIKQHTVVPSAVDTIEYAISLPVDSVSEANDAETIINETNPELAEGRFESKTSMASTWNTRGTSSSTFLTFATLPSSFGAN